MSNNVENMDVAALIDEAAASGDPSTTIAVVKAVSDAITSDGSGSEGITDVYENEGGAASAAADQVPLVIETDTKLLGRDPFVDPLPRVNRLDSSRYAIVAFVGEHGSVGRGRDDVGSQAANHDRRSARTHP